MIYWLLLILKIIGILIAGILGLLLLLVLLVIFAPVRYKGRVSYGPEPLSAKAGISWLLFVLRVKVAYQEKKALVTVSVFGIPLYRSDREKKPEEPKERHRKKKKPATKKQTAKQAAQEQPQGEAESRETVSESTPENKAGQAIPPPEEIPPESSKKPDFFKRISDKIRKIRETISNIRSRIKKLVHQKDALKELLSKEESRRAFATAWKELKHLLKHILPRKLSGTVVYGSGDPCSTGQALGIVSILYAKYGPVLKITPDFEEKRLECDVTVKGRIQVFTLLVIALKVLLNKEIRQLIHEFKQLKTVE